MRICTHQSKLLLAICLSITAVWALLSLFSTPAAQTTPLFSTPKQDGIAYAAWWNNSYLEAGADQSLAALADTGADWISLLVTCYQETITSTTISCLTTTRTPTDESLIHFTEIGYRSIDGANKAPWDWQISGTVDLQEQADCYQAVFEVFWDRPWRPVFTGGPGVLTRSRVGRRTTPRMASRPRQCYAAITTAGSTCL